MTDPSPHRQEESEAEYAAFDQIGTAYEAERPQLTPEEARAVIDNATNRVAHHEIDWKAQDSGMAKLRVLASGCED